MEPNTNAIDDEADFAAGFADTAAAPAPQPAAPNGEARPEEQDDATAAPATAAAAPAAPAATEPASASTNETIAPAADPFAGLPKEVRDLLAEIPTLRSRTEHAERQAKEFGGRVASLQSRLDKLGSGPAAVTAPAPQPTSNAKVQALRDQGLDEIADAIEAVMPKTSQEPPPAPAPTVAAPAAPAQDESPEFQTLTKLRPQWLREVNSSDYVLWLNRQPPAYRQRVESSSDPADILLSLQDFDKTYSAAPTPPPPPAPNNSRNARMTAALVPHGDGKRSPRGPQQLDEDAEFEAGFRGS